jgi:hypothetical protein
MRKLVTIREIAEVIEIPGADNIEIVRIDGWQCIAKKKEFKVGDKCCYFEIDSILPKHSLFEFMEKRKYRVRTIKCMKQISQGLALPVSILKEFNYNKEVSLGQDVTDIIGVVKYDPEAEAEKKYNQRTPKPWYYKYVIRIPLIGNLFRRKTGKGFFPKDITSRTDEERFQNLSHRQKEDFINETIEITEKVDGTSTTFIYRPAQNWLERLFNRDTFMVCSRNQWLFSEDNSWWWECAKKFDIKNKMKKLYKEICKDNQYLIIQGETISPNIQKNKYKIDDYKFFVFNLKSYNPKTGETIQKGTTETISIFNMFNIDLNVVPYLGSFTFESVEEFERFIEKRPTGIKSKLNDKVIAEGFVMRNMNQNVSKMKSCKFIHPEFLILHEE